MNRSISPLAVLIAAIGLIIAAFLLGDAIKNRNQSEKVIQVTGLGETDFTSDLIVWEGSFSQNNYDLQQAYSDLNRSKQIVSKYLTGKGIAQDKIIFSAVTSVKNTRPIYGANGNYSGEEFTGYLLTQEFKVESNEVDKIEKISREVTELLNQDIELFSNPPRYYNTKLSDLKIDLMAKATQDAKLRAETIAKNAGNGLGKLKRAEMGIFQITGQNSDEDYSWGGTFNTKDRDKTASITIKLTYGID